MQADSLVAEPRPVPSARPEEAAGAIRSMLFAVHDDPGLDARFQAALSLARACSAHLQLLHVIPVEAYAAVDSYGGAFISGEIVEVLQAESDKIRKTLEERLTIEDVSWNYEVTTSALFPEMIQHSALVDLVVMGREPRWHAFSRTGPSLLGALVCAIRAPICIPGDGCTTFNPFGKAIVAWNGSIEAANAVRSAVGLLKMASEVKVVRLTEEKDLLLEDEHVLQYLSRHGIHAEMETHLPRAGIGEDLLDRAAAAHAEYMVMGGYSHSRAGEFLFGGATRALLKECPLSLVMAH